VGKHKWNLFLNFPYSGLREKTKDFVGLKPLKEQFLRFAKTAILNEKRTGLGYKVNRLDSA
jgi:hypothetical protein